MFCFILFLFFAVLCQYDLVSVFTQLALQMVVRNGDVVVVVVVIVVLKFYFRTLAVNFVTSSRSLVLSLSLFPMIPVIVRTHTHSLTRTLKLLTVHVLLS